MVREIWGAVAGPTQPSQYSWIDLDYHMRRRLRKGAVVALLILLAVILLSLYFYIQLPPLKSLIASLSGNIAQSIKEKGEIPSWILWTGSLFLTILLAISGVFAWALVDLGKMHQKIDRITFRLRPRVGRHIISSIGSVLGCPHTKRCEIRRARGRDASRIMSEGFYHFANKKEVGDFNQEEKRRVVFSVWTHYYMSNFVFIYLLLLSLWVAFVAYIKSRWWVSLPFVALTVALIFLWRRRGRKYWYAVSHLADEQVRAFHKFDNEKFVGNMKSVIKSCGEPRCPLF